MTTLLRLPTQFSKTYAIAWLFAMLLALPITELGSETYKLLTYYPAPYGSYKKLVTTGDTWLASKSGKVLIGDSDNGKGVKLSVNGAIAVSDTASNEKGAIRWDGTQFWGCCNALLPGATSGGWFPLALTQAAIGGEMNSYCAANPTVTACAKAAAASATPAPTPTPTPTPAPSGPTTKTIAISGNSGGPVSPLGRVLSCSATSGTLLCYCGGSGGVSCSATIDTSGTINVSYYGTCVSKTFCGQSIQGPLSATVSVMVP